MADTPILYGDARQSVLAILQDAFDSGVFTDPDLVAPSGRVPRGTTGTTDGPFIAVGPGVVTQQVSRVVQRVTVPVTVWHKSDAEAHDLAQLALALLINRSSGQMQACKWLTGPNVSPDPDSGHPMASFTVRATMQGQLLSQT